jgi:hypothetical protein
MGKVGKKKHIRQLQKGGTSADAKYLASCYGKVRRTKEQAHEEADKLSILRAYKCSYCGYHHVGRAN